MKTKYLNVNNTDDRTELRMTARNHLVAFIEALGENLPLAFGFHPPGDGDARGYVFMTYSQSEQLRFYVSPGARPGKYVADKIYFVYTDPDSARGVMLEVTADSWASSTYAHMERLGTVKDLIEAGQRTGAN